MHSLSVGLVLRNTVRLARAASGAAARHNVAVVGSGNWGSVAAKMAAESAAEHSKDFETPVRMWVFEETVPIVKSAWAAAGAQLGNGGKFDADGVRAAVKLFGGPEMTAAAASEVIRASGQKGVATADGLGAWNAAAAKQAPASAMQGKLTKIINLAHENTKYLAGIRFPKNVIAVPDLREATTGADSLVIVTPHQFVEKALATMKPVVSRNALAISLVKGMHVTPDGFHLISALISEKLGVPCSVLMGANLASEVGLEQLSEATIGHRTPAEAVRFGKLFNRPYFHVTAVQDVEGVEMCGTLKNVVALGAGFVDGLGLGNNSKAAIIRIGLAEMMKLSAAFYPTVKTQTFFESAGVADLITTCFGGRNRKCAEAFARAGGGGKAMFDKIEAELLNGQKLQGVLTSDEVHEVLVRRGIEKQFPLFHTINRIVNGKIAPAKLVEFARLP